MSWNIAKPGDQINGPVAVTGNLNVDSNTLFVDSANNRVGVLTASPTVPLDVVGDAKISGNLTVDTNTLVVDAANNRLGIGTAAPGSTLDISAGTNLNLAVSGLTLDNFTNDGVGITFSRTTDDGDLMALGVCDTNKLGLFSREGLIFATGGAALYGQTSEKMRLDGSGNLGIGTATPSAKLDVAGSIYGTNILSLNEGTNNDGRIGWNAASDVFTPAGGSLTPQYGIARGSIGANTLGVSGYSGIGFFTGGTERLRIASSGNLGLGVTPKTWGSAYKALQINTTGAVTSYSGAVILGNNYYANSSGNPAYITAAAAGAYAIVGKAHTWYRSTDATPVADGACTLEPAMTLFSDGNLAIGTASNNGGVCVEDRYILVRSNNAKQFLRLGTDGSNDIYLSGAELLGITGAAGIRFSAGTGLPERLRIKSTGQVNFVGQASDPAGAAAGDVYYNTTTNKLKCYNGTTWNDLF